MCGLIVVLVAIAVGWLGCRYYDSQTATDCNNARGTVQQIKADNQSARADLGDAAAQIDDARSKLSAGQADLAAASGRVDELQDRADADAAVLDECQKIIDTCRIQLEEAKRIFTDVDSANKRND